MFRYKKSVPVSYERQRYIYFASRLYRELTEEQQRKLLNLCLQCGRRALPGALRVRDDGRRRDGRVHEALPLSLYAGASRAAVLRKFSTEPLTCRPFSLPVHEPVAGCFLLHNI